MKSQISPTSNTITSLRRKNSSNNTTNSGLHRNNKSSSSHNSIQKRIPQCIVFSCITITCFQLITLIPILLLQHEKEQQQNQQQQQYKGKDRQIITNNNNNINNNNQNSNNMKPKILDISTFTKTLNDYPKQITKDNRIIPKFSMSDLSLLYDESIVHLLPVSRGISGRNIQQTPAVINAQRGNIQCNELNVNSLAYWNNPIGTRDQQYHSPFNIYNDIGSYTQQKQDNTNTKQEMYISFASDSGGWNNIRMSMEIIFVIAAATGRTLILPPKEPLYLLHHDTTSKYRGFVDFFPIDTIEFQQHVKTISFEEFLIKEKDGPLGVTAQQRKLEQMNVKDSGENSILPTHEQLLAVADHCEKRKDSKTSCKYVYQYYDIIGHTPDISAAHTCLIFDENVYLDPDIELSIEVQDYIKLVCGEKRQAVYFNQHETQQHIVLHFKADMQKYRLLTHFYNMIHFTNPIYDHYYKRFVRDYLHYHDTIYCAAGKIVKAIQMESAISTRHHIIDENGAGGYSALHVRRGDLQYKKVKISAAEWYNNTKELYLPNELLYIATDERDKSFFDDIKKHHEIRFLDDYWELAGLANLDPNYMGMIDTIVASRGRIFIGTWFSTFSGYINRLRGYHGMSMNQSWYSFLPKKTAVHDWHIVDDFVYAYEYPDGWIGIDADVFPTKDVF